MANFPAIYICTSVTVSSIIIGYFYLLTFGCLTVWPHDVTPSNIAALFGTHTKKVIT